MRALTTLPHQQISAVGVMVRLPAKVLRLPRAARVPVRSLRCSAAPLSASVSSEKDAVATSSAPKRPSPWLFVGLGNPGSKYQGTRHNVGFEMIDAVAKAEDIAISTIQFKALVGKGMMYGSPVLLAKPQTYMNLSGESVKPLAAYYKIPAERVVLIYDDMDLDFATMKLLPRGGHGGHNGMKNVLNCFHAREVPRLRVGIGRPPGQMDPQAYVLQKFSAKEREEIDYAMERGVDALRLVTKEGMEKAVSTWNQVRKSRIERMKYSTVNVE